MTSHLPPVPPPPSGKLPIPRLDRSNGLSGSFGSRQARVAKACLVCRNRKIKCDGARPVCQNCADHEAECIYPASRKDRLRIVTGHTQSLQSLLQDLRAGASAEDKQRIDDLLASTVRDVAEVAALFQRSRENTPTDEPKLGVEQDEGEANVAAEVERNDDKDLGEHLLANLECPTTGYMGTSSEVQWLKCLHREIEVALADRIQDPYGLPGTSAYSQYEPIDAMHRHRNQHPPQTMDTKSCNFYLDDDPLGVDTHANPYQLPSRPMAEHLFRCYMQTVHNSLPILSLQSFNNQFTRYYDSVDYGTPYALPRKWQAMLNLVFAIGAVYSHLADEDDAVNERDHLLYHDRAWALDLKNAWWLTHPDLSQMQLTALLSFYYMAIGHINRSWMVTGMSIRFGYSLGLHIRNEDRTATVARKDSLSRIWWSVYWLDRTLSAITGRPTAGAEILSSTALPLPSSVNDMNEVTTEDNFELDPIRSYSTSTSFSNAGFPQATSASSSRMTFNVPTDLSMFGEANPGIFLTAVIQLEMVSTNALTQLYSPNSATKSWQDIQTCVAQLLEDLEAWRCALPLGLNFFEEHGWNQNMQQERKILEMYYHSANILICRPCLCHLDGRVRTPTKSSSTFDHQIAAQCVSAATSIAACLPDDMAVWGKEIYKILPWWSVVHYLMQATTVLLLEVFRESAGIAVVPAVTKLVRWLRELSSSNRTAERAYRIVVDLVQRLISLTFKDPQTVNELMLLLSEHPSPELRNVGMANFAGEPLSGEDFHGKYPLYQSSFDARGDFMPNTCNESIPSANIAPNASVMPVSGVFNEAPYSHAPPANVLPTEFDQHHPLPVGEDKIYIQAGPWEQQVAAMNWYRRDV